MLGENAKGGDPVEIVETTGPGQRGGKAKELRAFPVAQQMCTSMLTSTER
jgi:hypothetical protein